MHALFALIDTILSIFSFLLILNVVFSWLIHFNIINPYQPLVRTILQTCTAITEPVLAPLRRLSYRLIPNGSGLDLSPVIALLVIYFLRVFLARDLAPMILS